MTASAFLDLCLKGENALESILKQLQETGQEDAFRIGPLNLQADGQHLQLSVSELATALSGRIGSAEDELARIAQNGPLQDGGPPGTSKPGQGSGGKGDEFHAASSPASFSSRHHPAAGSLSGRVDSSSLEPGKLDMASFPSLGSTGQHKVGLCCSRQCLTACKPTQSDPASLPSRKYAPYNTSCYIRI